MTIAFKIINFFQQVCYLKVIVFVVISSWLYLQWKNRQFTKTMSSFYIMPMLPILGHVHHFVGVKGWTENLTNFFKNSQHPSLVWLFSKPFVTVASPQDIQTVTTITNDRGKAKLFRNSLNDGILLSTGEKWRKSRRAISSVFTPSMMPHYATVIDRYSTMIVDKIKPFADTGTVLDIGPYLFNANLDMIFENMADYQSRTLEEDDSEIFSLLEEEAYIDSTRFRNPLLYFDFFFNMYLRLTNKSKISRETKNYAEKVVGEIFSRDRAQHTENKRKIMSDTLLKLHNSDSVTYNKQNMRDDIINMIQAGSATTARTVGFALLFLAMYPKIQQKVYEEIKATLGETNRPIEFKDLDRLVYSEQCIKETLRKYPVVAFTARQHTEDIRLDDEKTIPANCDIIIGIYALHHNEQYYPNSNTWDPDRFAPEAINNREKNTFLPFGTGPRMCVGAKYAIISTKIQLAHILRSYQVSTDMKPGEIPLDMDVVLKSADGYKLRFFSRV